MPSLAELRKKIRGIASTRQITKAMKMVAGARFARAARQMNDAAYYLAELEKPLLALLAMAGPPKPAFRSLYRVPGSASLPMTDGKVGILIIAADKGLCGDFNNAIMREADSFLKKNGDRTAALIAVGRKSVEHYKSSKVVRRTAHSQFFNRFDFSIAETIGGEALKLYKEEHLTELVAVHSHFKSRIKQQVTVTRLLPIEAAPPADTQYRGTLLEPADEEDILRTLLPAYFSAKLYALLRDSFAAELAARMSAMDNATRNAGELIESITLEMNKVRQAVITRELAEIIATNEVVK